MLEMFLYNLISSCSWNNVFECSNKDNPVPFLLQKVSVYIIKENVVSESEKRNC